MSGEHGWLFFQGWDGPLHVAVSATGAYIFLLVLLRLSGKRTISKMNAFDFAITVAFGSTLSTTILEKRVALLDGCLGLTMLVGLQFAVTWMTVHSKTFDHLIKHAPTALFFRGEYCADTMRKERVAKDEILSAVREYGLASMEDVEAVVLETDATFSVVRKSAKRSTSLSDVDGIPKPPGAEAPPPDPKTHPESRDGQWLKPAPADTE
jgi:uncharacterized membrane protein YcaP (DUF421 family)